MQTVRIRTAQNVDIEYAVASVGDRILATLIDGVIVLAYFLAVSLLWMGIAVSFEPRFSEGSGIVMIAMAMLPVFLYDLVLEITMDGQTFGKKRRRIKVVKLDGSPPTIGSYLLRWLFRPLDITLFTGGVALIVILINGKGQRLGDIAAGTTVIKLTPRATLDDTIFMPVEEGYVPVFRQAGLLDDRTVSTVKEVLVASKTQGGYDEEAMRELLEKTRRSLETRMNVRSDLPPRDFLETVLKDYNALKQRG
jgi:uncharacterized RDD family membrane protein YckC